MRLRTKNRQDGYIDKSMQHTQMENNKKMKKLMMLLMLVLLTGIVFAKTTINPVSLTSNNDTWRNQISVIYSASEKNEIRSGEKLNVIVQYSCPDYDSIVDYNNAYLSHNILNITLSTIYTPQSSLSNGTQVFEETITEIINIGELDMPFSNFKKFFYLQDKEALTVILDTKFISDSALARDTICRFDIVVGTEGCNRCKELEFNEFIQDVSEAKTIKTYNSNIWTKIKNLFSINYELFIIIYYLILISLLLAFIILIFYFIMWLYHWLKHWGKK